MSVNLQSLASLSKIAASIPKGNTSVVTDVTDRMLSVTSALYNAQVNDVVDPLAGLISDITNAVKGVINSAVDTIREKVDSVITAINKTVTDTVNGAIRVVNGVAKNIIDTMNSLMGDIGAAIDNAIGWLVDKIQGVINELENVGSVISNAISSAIGNIGDFIANSINAVFHSVADYIAGVINDVGDWIKGVYDTIRKAVTDAISAASKWVSDAIQTVKTAITSVVQTLKDAYESTKETVLTTINNVMVWIRQQASILSQWFWKTVSTAAGWFAKNVLPLWNNAVIGAQDILKIGEGVWGYMQAGNFQGAFDIIDKFTKGLGIPAPIHSIWSIVSAIAYFWETVRLQFVGMEVAAQKQAVISLALDPISMNDAAQGVFRGLMSKDQYNRNAALGGVNKDYASIALDASRPLPSPGQAQQLFLRGEIDEAAHDKILSSYGFSNQYIKEIKALYAIIPPIQDIITMAVKEAFSPAIAERFGQYQDLPAAFVEWGKKQGLSEEWSSRYWAAHWDLPSPQMGFTMYQRGIIEHDDLTLLLKALDVMPFWREKLINLAYNPPTRIDVRRMYKMGVIDEDQVYKFHLDIGYSPDNARLLTEFTKRYSAPEDQSQQDTFTELARATYSAAYKDHIISKEEYAAFLSVLKYADEDAALLISLDDYAIEQKEKLFDTDAYRKAYVKLITNAYDRGLVNRNDAKPMLVDLGFGEDEAELEMTLLDYNRELALKDILVQQLHNQYVGFIIDNVQLHTTLDAFGFYSDEIDRLIQEWDIERSFRDKRPSYTDLRRFYNKGLITLNQLLDELRGIGYNEKYIELFNADLQPVTG